MTVILLGFVVAGFLARRVRHGWVLIPLVLIAAPFFWTVIGAFDDGESWLLRAAMGPMFSVPTAVGWFLGRWTDNQSTPATLTR